MSLEAVIGFVNRSTPGALKGYVEDAGGGRIILYNTGDRDWHRCDVRKPEGTHYVIEKLSARDQESVRSGLFTTQEPEATLLSLLFVPAELREDGS